MTYPDNFENKIGFDAVRASLRQLCATPLGSPWVDDMSFLTDFEAVTSSLHAVSEMLSLSAGGDSAESDAEGSASISIDGVHDLRPELARLRVGGTFLPPADLRHLAASLAAINSTYAFMVSRRDENGDSSLPALAEVTSSLLDFPDLSRLIDRILDRFGNVRDNASPALADIRHNLAATSGTVNSIMRRVISRAVGEGYLDPDVTPSVRDGRLVLPVSPMHKRKISGIVHDESASGKTFFIEPAEIVEVNNRIRELTIEERREVTRIMIEVADVIRPRLDEILASLSVMGHLDFIRAKARYAAEIGGVLPHLSPSPEIEWYHAVHPVLLLSLRRQGKEIVPLDITLSSPASRILIISGPNAGGKSVCLKTVGIVQYMMQCGLLPPLYENSHMGLFADIFIDIGDDQSIENDLSTYSSHLRNMKHFLQRGNSSTLVLIDEFGGGTEPQIGGAIAQAILGQFNRQGLWGVITTHYQNLKQMAEDTPGLINGSMLYDRHLMQPLFRLSIGNPGSSFAIEIARKTGLPQSILSEAEEIVGSDYINLDRYLLDIARDKKYWENKRSDIRRKEKRMDEVLAQYEQDADTLRQQRRDIIADAREQARRILDESNAAVERTIRDIRKSQAEKEATLEARRRLQAEKTRLSDADSAPSVPEPKALARAPRRKKRPSAVESPSSHQPRPLAVGDFVKLDGQGTPGKIIEIQGNNAVVAFGMLKTTVALVRLKPTMARPDSGATAKASFISAATTDAMRERRLHFKQEIDVRGMRVDEALQAVTYFIDDAIQFNARQVRILHGTGTGALRQALRQYLDTVPGVQSYRDEHVQLGGAGITVITLS